MFLTSIDAIVNNIYLRATSGKKYFRRLFHIEICSYVTLLVYRRAIYVTKSVHIRIVSWIQFIAYSRSQTIWWITLHATNTKVPYACMSFAYYNASFKLSFCPVIRRKKSWRRSRPFIIFWLVQSKMACIVGRMLFCIILHLRQRN